MHTPLPRRYRVPLPIPVLLLLGAVAACSGQSLHQEAVRLAELLHVKAGSQVAEIGGGGGEMALQMSRIVGAGGHLYATDLDAGAVKDMQSLFERRGAKNITVVQGAVDKTNLPAACCDAIYMRRVFHHFTEPAAMNRSLFDSLRAGGRLVVIDFGPGGAARKLTGMPENRKHHGIRRVDVKAELEVAGFRMVQEIEDWPGDLYCLVFEKPVAPAR